MLLSSLLFLALTLLQKIDKIKNQLTTMADLIKGPLTDTDEQDLEQDELSILQKANILLSSRQAFGKRKVKHIIFADSAEEGTYLAFLCSFNP